ncbi:DUF4012 domain-containing protein [Candidatus Uhrbacteria bacterium]|nr:DUF4012 domain-containing protein [Candidatus Uhrbacteria bacterium]
MPKASPLKKKTPRKTAKTIRRKPLPTPLEFPLLSAEDLGASLRVSTAREAGEPKIVAVHQTFSPPLSPYVIRMTEEAPVAELPKAMEEPEEIFEIISPPIAPPVERTPFRLSLPAFDFTFLARLGKQTLHGLGRLVSLPRPSRPAFSRLAIRPLLGFAVTASIFILPASGFSALTKLDQVKQSFLAQGLSLWDSVRASLSADPDSLPNTIGSLRRKFTETQASLRQTVGALDTLLPLIPRLGTTYEAGTLLLGAASHLTEAAEILQSGIENLANQSQPLTNRLIRLEFSLRNAFPLIAAADRELHDFDPLSLPPALVAPIASAKENVRHIRTDFDFTIELLPALQEFLGHDRVKRYLIVFQNSNELRPTGGFIGSYALVDLDRGNLRIVDIPGGGPYELACCLTEQVRAPAPLGLIEPRWQFHDANWFPDFPASARKLMWFYEKSGGPSVDGVIAVNSSLLPKLLSILGPIEAPEFDRLLTPENVIEETQKIVEQEYDRVENQPKKFIALLAPRLLEKILAASSDELLAIASLANESFPSKEIQIFVTDPELQETFSRAGWTGEMRQTNGDYLLLASANIAGGKTSGAVQTSLALETTIAENGGIINKLEITRTHHGKKSDPRAGLRNIEYLRVFVPEGSTLLAAEGFEAPPEELFEEPPTGYRTDDDLENVARSAVIDPASGTVISREHGKTVFGNWLQLDPGVTQTIRLRYQLPFSLFTDDYSVKNRFNQFMGLPSFKRYTLLVEKQSGLSTTFQSKISWPPSLKPAWHSPHLNLVSSQGLFEAPLDRSLFAALLFEQTP